MNTSREDDTADSTADRTPTAEPREEAGPRGEAAAPADAAGTRDASDFVHAAPSRVRGGGVFSPEALSLTGLLLLLPVLVGGRLMERLAWFGIGSGVASPEQLALLRAEMMVTGAVAALSVLLASVSLLTGGARTRAWARWSASAVVVAGLLALLMCVAAFVGIASAA